MKRESLNQKPLVSIIIITYNSSKYVLDTLESAKEQTYINTELIITDDGSSDNTLDICKKWIDLNGNAFKRVKLVTTNKNSGIPANCNRGVKAAKGEWIKLIAGDDILLPNCIDTFVNYTRVERSSFYFSDFIYINESGTLNDLNSSSLLDMSFFKLDEEEQYRKVLIGGVFIPAPTCFINRETLFEVGLFDEEIFLCEDYPMWIKVTKEGYKLTLVNEKTVKYRLNEEGVMRSKNILYEQSMKRVFFKYRFKSLLAYRPLFAIDLLVRNLVRTAPKIYEIVQFLLPSTYINYIRNGKS